MSILDDEVNAPPLARGKRPPPLFQETPKERVCLKCNECFHSVDGARLCRKCNRKNLGSAKRVDEGGSYRRLGGVSPQ